MVATVSLCHVATVLYSRTASRPRGAALAQQSFLASHHRPKLSALCARDLIGSRPRQPIVLYRQPPAAADRVVHAANP